MYIGIDLGGTNIAAGLTDDGGKLLKKLSAPTGADRGAEAIAADMVSLSEKLLSEAGKTADGIGIGCPGTVDNTAGKIVYLANLPCMNGFDIRGYIDARLHIPVSLANDADCAAMGEYIALGEDKKSFILVTLGTGIGGGIIIDGRLWNGFNSVGSEMGHMTLISGGEKCGCGKRGCWEAYASVTALRRQTDAAMKEHPESLMHELVRKHGKISGRTAFQAAAAGDAAGRGVVEKYIGYVADGIVSIENIFQPEVIVIGGGISKEGDVLLKPIREYADKFRYNKYMPHSDIRIARLFNDAGIVGAAMLTRRH